MKKILSLIIILLLFACTYVQAKNGRNVDDIAKKVASRIIAQLNYNKSQKDSRRKGHIINLNEFNPSQTTFYSHFVNNGSFFWNLTGAEQSEIGDHVSSYPEFNDIEYIIVVGSIFKYDELQTDIQDKDWGTLLKNKDAASTGVADTDDEHAFFKKVKVKVDEILNVQPKPTYTKFIINWYMSVFSEDGNGTNKKYKVETKTFVTNRSGWGSSGFGFESLDGQLAADAVSLSKKDWIKRNVDFDARTIRYVKDLETNVFFVNKSSKQITGNDFLKDLFEGKLTETEGGDTYRNLKVILLISDETTSAADKDAFAKFTSKTHIVVTINYFQARPQVSVKYPTPEMNLAFSSFINASVDPRGFWDRFSDGLGSITEDMFVILYDGLDFLAKGIGKLHIPEKVWNCCSSKYDPDYEAFWRDFIPLNWLTGYIDALFQNGYGIEGCDLFAASRGNFAFMVGLWNGLVDIFEGVPTMLKLLVSAGVKPEFQLNPETNKPYRNDWTLFGAEVGKHGGGVIGFIKLMGSTLKELHDPTKPCLFYHSVGSDIFNIIAAIITGGESLASSKVGAIIRNVFITVEKLDVVSNIIGNTGKAAAKYLVVPVMTPVAKAIRMELQIISKELSAGGKAAWKVISENGNYIFEVLNPNNFNLYNKFAWETANIIEVPVKNVANQYSKIKLAFPNIPVTPGSFVDRISKQGLRLEIVKVVTDGERAIANDEGVGAVVVKAVGEDGPESQGVAFAKDPEKLKNGAPEIGYPDVNSPYTKIEAILSGTATDAKKAEIRAALTEWDKAIIKKLDDALAKFPGLDAEIVKNPKLLESFNAANVTWEGKYGVRVDLYDKKIKNSPVFTQYIDDELPELANGNKPKDRTELGRAFDQDYLERVQNAIRENDFTDVPHVKKYIDQGYYVAEGQVKIKPEKNINVEVKPDVLFVRLSDDMDDIVSAHSIWDECKLKITTEPSVNQKTIWQLLDEQVITQKDLIFVVTTKSLEKHGLHEGATLTINIVNQISIENNRMKIIPIWPIQW